MRPPGWVLLALCLALAWPSAEGCNFTDATLVPCSNDLQGGGACYCLEGSACWYCHRGDTCSKSVGRCVSKYYFTVLGVTSIIIAVCCYCCLLITMLWYYQRKQKEAAGGDGDSHQSTPIEGIAIQFTTDHPQQGVPVDSRPSPTPNNSGGGGHASPSRDPSFPRNNSDVSHHSGETGLYCGPLVRSASQSSIGTRATEDPRGPNPPIGREPARPPSGGNRLFPKLGRHRS